MTPYKRFSITLASALLVSTVVVATVASVLVRNFFIRDTAVITRAAVETHFRQLFGFDLFAGGAGHQHAGPAKGYGAAGYKMAPAPIAYGAPGSGAALDAMVRLHFDLYDVLHTVFYRPDGTVVYSYHPSEPGSRPPGTVSLMEMARDRDNYAVSEWGEKRTPALRQYLSLSDGGEVVGVVEVHRNIAPLLAEIRLIQMLVSGVVLALFGGLFFALRRIYVTSTEAISSQSRALSEAFEQLNATYDATVHALSAALDSRDSETEGHALRVVAYTARLSRQLGLDQKAGDSLLRGALLHDVGKIGVPDAILNKKGPLDDAEWDEMRRHPQIGHRMLREIPFLADALPVVLHHHERYDGTGYPAGLKGEEIPLGARIFSIIDTFDAITSDRPYRRARSVKEAQQEIRRGAGVQFDPRLVEAFLAVPEQEWSLLGDQTRRSRQNGALPPRFAAVTA